MQNALYAFANYTGLSIHLEHILRAIESNALKEGDLFFERLRDRDHIGGFLSVYEPSVSRVEPTLQLKAHHPQPGKIDLFKELSFEKPKRAVDYVIAQPGLMTEIFDSFHADYDVEKKKFGGGFRINLIMPSNQTSWPAEYMIGIGFSGLPEVFDAAICLMLLVNIGALPLHGAYQLAEKAHPDALTILQDSERLGII